MLARQLDSSGLVGDFAWPVRRLRSVDFLDCDLPGSRIAGGLFGRVEVSDCTFIRVRLDPFSGSKLDISDCRFERVDFAGTVNATLRDSTIVRSVFERCDIRYLDFDRCDLRQVTLDRPRATRTAFRGSVLGASIVSGRLGSLLFVDSVLTDVDFSKSFPGELAFIGSKLTSVRFPRSREAFMVFKPVFARLARQLLEDMSPHGRTVLESWIAVFDVAESAPLLVGREILAPFKASADRELLLDAMFPHAVAEVEHFSPPG